MKQGGAGNEVGNNIQEMEDHGNLGMKISETGTREQDKGENWDEWRGVGNRMEIGQK